MEIFFFLSKGRGILRKAFVKKARFSFFFFFYAISSTLIYSRYYYYFFFFIQLDQNETRFDRGWNRFRNGPLTILFEHVWIILFPIRLLIILPVKINWHTPEVNNRWSPVAIIIDPLRHPSNWWWKPRQQSFVSFRRKRVMYRETDFELSKL